MAEKRVKIMRPGEIVLQVFLLKNGQYLTSTTIELEGVDKPIIGTETIHSDRTQAFIYMTTIWKLKVFDAMKMIDQAEKERERENKQ
ncbi:MAG: hypothetical protein ISS87_01925 [Candidatus Pacebacteria bacterium]|nr:hypothetical protein [Candidatus Paceibacterota bacterium]